MKNDVPAMGGTATNILSDAPIAIFYECSDCGAVNDDFCICDELEQAEKDLSWSNSDDDEYCPWCGVHLILCDDCDCNEDYELSDDDIEANEALRNGEFGDFNTPIIGSDDDELPF